MLKTVLRPSWDNLKKDVKTSSQINSRLITPGMLLGTLLGYSSLFLRGSEVSKLLKDSLRDPLRLSRNTVKHPFLLVDFPIP